jgi:hypothetical protein
MRVLLSSVEDDEEADGADSGDKVEPRDLAGLAVSTSSPNPKPPSSARIEGKKLTSPQRAVTMTCSRAL